MRKLIFLVDGQTLRQDPNCDFSGLAPGSEDYVQAEFRFSPEWHGFNKVAAFYSRLGNEYEPQLLTNGATCIIPVEALAKTIFKVEVLGMKGLTKLRTNRLTIEQRGGKV